MSLKIDDLGYEIGDGTSVVQMEDGQGRIRDSMIGGDGADMGIARRQRFAVCGLQAAGFDFRDRLTLVAFDQNEIAGGETGEDFLELGFGRAAQLMHDGVTRAGNDGNFMGAAWRWR